jgi:catechol 2,3-dioxygenase-like lactoylglutathione lyase family enzyme
MATISGTDFVTLPTKDYAAASEFYGTVLGLPFSKQWGDMPAGEYETGSLTIALMQSEAFGQEFSPHVAPLALHVDDFEGAKAELESRGVEFLNTIDSGVCHMGIFQDPDGNSLMIHHRYAPQGAKPGSS